MAEIVVGIVATLLAPAIELGKCLDVPIKRHFRYLCCFDTNIQYLRDEAGKLDLAKEGLQMQVAQAQNNGKLILPQVENWLTSSNEIQLNAGRIEIEISNVQSGCFPTKSRYSLSRRAEQTTQAIKQLRDDHSKFDLIYVSPPPTSMESVPIRLNYEFESRKQIEEDIMTSLRDDKINIIGLCGLGGVGKTTMAKRIMNRAREEHLFDEVVMVVVSQQKDLSKIQLECAELLGLKLEQQTLSARAHTLRVRLMGKKRVLMILDDIWSRLNLEDIGIPCQSGFTILFTSRNRDVLRAMDVQKVCDVSILSEREALFLFKDKAGACVDDLNLVSIAEAVVTECGGLPVALVTVGRALKDKTSKYIWEDALRQLRASNPIGLSDVLKEVYNPLKLSYDFLENPHAKSIFLLCSMFPEDRNISLEQLTSYGWGLRMFGGVENLGEARNYVYALTDMLKSRSLLLDGSYSNDHVRMHDVIRDTAIFIASNEGRFNLNSSSILDWWREHPHSDGTWIALYPEERAHVLSWLISKNLRLLLVNNSYETQYQIRYQFFEETNGLNVLSISFGSLPQTVQLLKHLRTLYLHHCTVDNISVVGELSSLEILYCFRCDFKDLPTEIGKLNRLRLLEVDLCRDLKRIAPGALSQLVQLEELRIVNCFEYKWDIASLKELESLSSLTCLEIEIHDSALAGEELCLSNKIIQYVIRIGEGGRDWTRFYNRRKGFEKKLYLDLKRRFTPRNWIHKFLNNSQELYLQGYDTNNCDLSLSQSIEWLELRDCPTVKTLVSTASASSIDSRIIDAFPFLKTLRLFQVSKLEEICDGPIPQGSNSFKNLQVLTIEHSPALKHLWKSPIQNVSLCNLSVINIFNCDSIHSLFSLAIAKGCLPQLGHLYIRSCKMMEQVLCSEGNGTDHEQSNIILAKLEFIRLQNLAKLTTFCKGIENIEFPLLIAMGIYECPNLKSLVSWGGNDPICQDNHRDNESFHLFCNQKVAFGNLRSLFMSGYKDVTNIWCCQIPNSFFNGLESLKIDRFNKIRSLFPSSIARSLFNLKHLETLDCQEMIQVIADNECEDDQSPIVLFPNLEELYLEDLPKLESFCEWRRSFALLQLPSLKEVTIKECFHMERFNLGSVTTPNLERIQIDDDDKINIMDDLNDTLQKKYQMKKKEGKRDYEKGIHEEENSL